MVDIRRIQLIILNIMVDIDKLCRDNGIEYYLIGGSALGALRHDGFIPWDDDLDICMTDDNYNRFIEVCSSQLDTEKYFFQEGEKDWHLPFSKVRLRGTYLAEREADETVDISNRGIWVDIFKFDNMPDEKYKQIWQYICAKTYLAYKLGSRSYKTASFNKKVIMCIASILKVRFIRNFIVKQVTKYNSSKCNFLGLLYVRTRFSTAIIPSAIMGKPVDHIFEGKQFYVAEDCDAFLKIVFGDYMKLPPIEQQVPLHTIEVDFGKY